MLDKQLTESAWKTFAKGKAYKDAPLIKALAALEGADKQGTAQALEALDAVEKEADALRKANKADKELGTHLAAFDKAVAKQRKSLEDDRDKAQADEEQEEDSPALLTTKLLPLLRQVRKGEPMKALVVTVGKDCAVMLARRSIAPARAKLLKEYLGASGAVKIIPGDCIFEENAVTFVLQSAAAGMAKRLKEALLKQVEQRMKVRVRGLDPNDLDEDLEGGEEGTEGDQPPPDAAALEWRRQAAAMEPRVLQALKNNQLDVARIRAVWAFAQQKAQGGDPAAALKALGVLEPLLGTPTPGTERPSEGDNPQLQAALQEWRSLRDALVARLREMAQAVAAAKLPGTDEALIEVSAVFKQLRGDPVTEAQIADMETWLRDDDVVADVCDTEQDVRTPLIASLQSIRSAVKGAA